MAKARRCGSEIKLRKRQTREGTDFIMTKRAGLSEFMIALIHGGTKKEKQQRNERNEIMMTLKWTCAVLRACEGSYANKMCLLRHLSVLIAVSWVRAFPPFCTNSEFSRQFNCAFFMLLVIVIQVIIRDRVGADLIEFYGIFSVQRKDTRI